MKKKRIIIGISGASGIIYGIRFLQLLANTEFETHLIVSKAAQQARAYETTLSANDLSALADVSYPINDIAASLASGSFKTEGMIITPCSMRTLANIAHGISSNLLTRAADVVLKERRRLVLLARETPLHLGHLENMKKVTEMGAIVAPPVPAFYNRPQSLDDLITHTVGRVLDLFDLDLDVVNRWQDIQNNKRGIKCA
jgi:4-hydroxy-3-polyprenylbenzoate decarboxylase